MLNDRVKTYSILLGFSLLIHIFASLDYILLSGSISLPETWLFQFNLLLGASFLCSILTLAFRRFSFPILLVKSVILQIIGYPLGEYLGIETLLLISIILELVYYLRSKYGLLASTFLIILTFRNQKEVVSWGETLGRPDNHQLLFFMFISFLILALSSYLKYISERSNKKTEDIIRLDSAVKKLTTTNLDYQSYAVKVEKDSIESERKRISREMHDIIGYTLTNQLMIIQAALSMKTNLSPEIEPLLLRAKEETMDGMQQARVALRKLRDLKSETESGTKLIYKLVKTFEEVTGITIDIEFSNTKDSFGYKMDKAIYRLIQEALTNAFRHGKATKIRISLVTTDTELLINVWDNGIGASSISEGIGLKGMKERLSELDGELEISSKQGGFLVRGRIPIEIKERIENEAITC